MFPKGYTYSGYQLLTDAFHGSTGEVYKALDLNTKKEVAIKFTKNRHDAKAYKRFENENEFLHKLHPHEHIVQAHSNVIQDPLHAFYTMEFIELGLEQYATRFKSGDFDEKIELCKQICGGLAHAHSKKIYHRDLHSENIRVHADKAKLLDFGLGKDGYSSSPSSIGEIIWLGTATAPESLFYIADSPSHAEDIHRDIYALGIILYNIFGSSNVPYNLDLKHSMTTYIGTIVTSQAEYINTYLKLPESDRLAHYDKWLKTLDPHLDDKLAVSLTDVTRGNKLSDIIKKASKADHRDRYNSVDDILLDIEGL